MVCIWSHHAPLSMRDAVLLKTTMGMLLLLKVSVCLVQHSNHELVCVSLSLAKSGSIMNSPSMQRQLSLSVKRLPVISDLDHFGPGDFGRLSVISDGDFGRCAVKSDGDFGRCVVNSTSRWIRTVISDGVRWIRTANLVVFYIIILVLCYR